MKFLITIFLFWSLPALANDYYFSLLSGNDANPGTQAQPKQSLATANTLINSASPGDGFYFKRGENFTGILNISRSGSASNPIIIDAYGTGSLPTFTSFANLNSWTNQGANIWRSTYSTSGRVNAVVVQGKMQDRGRWPNVNQYDSGFLHFEQHNGFVSITDNDYPAGAITNWVGAEICIRNVRWMLNRYPVTYHSGGTFGYPGIPDEMGGEVIDNFGYFIQNDPRTLDQQNEWYADGSGISLYSTTDPSSLGVRMATVDTLVKIKNSSYITIRNISFQGANSYTFYAVASNHIVLTNCEAMYSGGVGVKMDQCPYSTFDNGLTNYTAIRSLDISPFCDYSEATDNVFKNTGMWYTLAGNGNLANQGPFINGFSVKLLRNRIDSCGYNGIVATGSDWNISYNDVSNFGLLFDDGAGVYTSGPGNNRIFRGNRIINGRGNKHGASNYANDNDNTMNGVGLDDLSEHVLIDSNVVANTSGEGLGLHNSRFVIASNNIFFNTRKQSAGALHDINFPGNPIYDFFVINNTFVSTSRKPTINILQGNDYNALFWINTRRDSADAFNFGYLKGNRFWKPYQDQNFLRVSWRYVPAGSDCSSCTSNDSTYYYRRDVAYRLSDLQRLGKDTGSVGGLIEVPYTYSLTGPEMYPNGAFTSNINDVRNRNASVINHSWASHGIQGGALKATYTGSSSAESLSVLLYRETGTPTFLAGHTYRIRFKLQCPADLVPFQLTMFSNGGDGYASPENNLVYGFRYAQTIDRLFTPTSSLSVAYLEIRTDSSFLCPWFMIDSVSMQEVTNVQYAAADDYVRLITNPSSVPVTFYNDGSWMDDRGKPLPKAVTVPGNYGAVMIRNRNAFLYKGKVNAIIQ